MIRAEAVRKNRAQYEVLIARAEGRFLIDAERALTLTGERTVSKLKGFTSEMRPPVHAGGSPRPAHPGHWADITGLLVRRYQYAVQRAAGSVRLKIWNDMWYAKFLERLNGFYVVRGIWDRFGVGRTTLGQVIKELKLPWRIVRR